MSPWQIAHLLVLGLWGGCVAAEIVMELVPRRHPELWPATVRFHFWIDLCVELPLLLAVLATGTMLLPPTPWNTGLVIKVAAGLTAVSANLFCVGVVVRRGVVGAASPAAPWLHRLVLWSAAVGVPAGLTALVLGLKRIP